MAAETVQLSWNQPVCESCWIEKEGTWVAAPEHGAGAQILTEVRRPVLFSDPDHVHVEKCCYCGEPTIVGIFQRIDPKTVRFPATKKDD